MINLSLTQELKLIPPLFGGLTLTIFPKTERKLGQIEYQKALEFVASKKRMDRYRSVMDFLFCESFPEWRFDCFCFYNEKGPRLAEHPKMTKQKRIAYDVFLCDGILELCYSALQKKRWLSWKDLRLEIEKLFRLVA